MFKNYPIISYIVLIILLIGIAGTSPIKISASPTPTVYLDPLEIIDETLLPNSTFTVEVRVDNIPEDPGVAGVEFKLTWDPAILVAEGMEEVLFHSVTPESEWGNIWRLKHVVADDYVWYAYTWMDMEAALSGGYAPITGNHTIAILTFKVKSVGSTDIEFAISKLGDSEGSPVVHESINGYFRNSPPPPPKIAELYVDPPEIFDLNMTPCNSFTVNISVLNVEDLYTFEFKLGYDNTVLNAVDVEPGFPIPSEATFNVTINNAAGYLWVYASLYPLYGTITGNETLAKVHFHVIALGESVLDLYDVQLLDTAGEPLSFTVTDGSFKNVILATIAVEPQEIMNPSLGPYSTFDINITIAHVENLYGYEFKLFFDPKVILCIDVEIRTVFNETNFVPNLQIDNFAGCLWVNVTYYPPAEPINVTSPEAFVTVEFRVKALGCSPLTLNETKLVDADGQLIPHEVVSGNFCTIKRDIAVETVTVLPAEVYEGGKINVTLTVRNNGDINETFEVEIYCNESLIQTISILDLAPNQTATKNIEWETDGLPPGFYMLHVIASELPYEVNATNNFGEAPFRILILGDVNSDDVVDIYDAMIAAGAFGAYPGHEKWNPRCDLNNDSVIDIFDIIIIANNFGRRI